MVAFPLLTITNTSNPSFSPEKDNESTSDMAHLQQWLMRCANRSQEELIIDVKPTSTGSQSSQEVFIATMQSSVNVQEIQLVPRTFKTERLAVEFLVDAIGKFAGLSFSFRQSR
ncbi:hypothetical protein K0504_10140 [Neiella marina]|uniref:Uncharacterized protein n=1 Tax=Neiella holothuriorum TaxID=2870530 RepID=A0ABS7EGG4_9GAMM|nr:hypothetical protein [Neiella holothuriorum]MBW8191398.1 hypothetical protein [Neiella holothuriorum]